MFRGYRIGNSGMQVSHLQFVDDTLIVVEDSDENVWAIKAML